MTKTSNSKKTSKSDLKKKKADSSEAVVYNVESESTDFNSDIMGPNKSTIKEEINILTKKEQLKQERKNKKEARKFEKAKQNMMKKHRRKINKNPEKLIRYDTDPKMGLSNEIVEKRILDNLVNYTKAKTSKSIPAILFSNIVTFFNLLTFAIAAVLISVKAFTDLVFLGLVIVNIIIGIIQEVRAKKTIDRLSLISAPTAIVRRAGSAVEISVSEVVLDDLLLLESGKQICADSIVIEGSVEVNESLLTGESDAIVKKPGDILYSGSFVVSGKCSARVDKVGNDNYIEQLTSQAKKYKKPKSDLMFSLSWIIRVMAIIIIPIGALLFWIMYYRNGLEYVYSIRKTAGAMIGMIPSGLFLMTSIALAVGVVRLAQRNVLVQELYCIEMLARVDCICLDKTGTITDGTMSVKNVIDYNTIAGLATKNIISAMLNALEDHNLTSVALEEKFGLGKRIKHIAAIPFSSQRKYQAITFDKYGTFILGAPEFVLKEKFNLIQKDVNKYAALGYRVLCLAHRNGEIEGGNLPSSPVEVVSMILIEDNIRPDAINTIKYFRESGVSVRVISGDNPITVSKISQRAGIERAEDYISLDGLDDNEVIKAATKYTVFGRVSPAQKKLLIKTLKESGLTVAMTGDGVNDILALKEADCSIAVASGSEAARNVSHLVLLDSNFDSMPKVVSEGRRVINNISSVASLFLTKTIFSLLLAIQALQTGAYPISTNQLILIDLLAIGLPSLVLVMEPNNKNVQGKFLINVIKKAMPGAIVILFISIITFSLADSLNFDSTTLSTIIVIAATHTCMMVLFKTCKPFNTLRKFLCGLCYSLFLFCILTLPSFLEFRPIFSFAEYYSDDITTRTVSSYPEISISQSNYYVINGVVTSFQKSPNSKASNVTATTMNNKYYYRIGDTDTNVEVVIPDISYNDLGFVTLGGHKVDNLKYNDAVKYTTLSNGSVTRTVNLTINTIGEVCYVTEDGDLVPLKITLSKEKSNEYYNHFVNYGTAKDTQVNVKVMPKVEYKDGELYINGSSVETITTDSNIINYKYRIGDGVIPESISDDAVTIEYNSSKQVYELKINGFVVNKVDSINNVVVPYTVNLPSLSTSGDQYNSNNVVDADSSGVLYIDAVSTEYSIFEIYGKYNADDKYYFIYDLDGNEIKSTDNYIFPDIASGFGAYKDDSNTIISPNLGDSKINVVPISATYTLSVIKHNAKYSYPNSSDQSSDARIGVSIDNSIICPDIDVTESGRYIIDGYYTDFVYQDNELNPKINDDNSLILGGVTTDYIVSADNIITQKGAMVKKLSTSSSVFLLMLCLLAAPLMKILQAFVPWIVKQVKYIRQLLTKY